MQAQKFIFTEIEDLQVYFVAKDCETQGLNQKPTNRPGLSDIGIASPEFITRSEKLDEEQKVEELPVLYSSSFFRSSGDQLWSPTLN